MANPPDDARAWTAATIDAAENWYAAVPDGALRLLRGALARWRREPRPVADLRLAAADVEAGRGELAPVLATLERGRGFVVLDNLSDAVESPGELSAAYWLVGQLLGVPFAQNVEGTLLYDVKDTGRDLAAGARFSVTSYESSFHTDNSFGDTLLDYVGLLCLRPAQAGGVNQVVSGYHVHEVLRREHPDALAALCRPFHVDRRGGVRPGEPPTSRMPVIAEDGPGLVYRYLRHWIEVGHQKANEPLTPGQVAALDVLDATLRRPEYRAEFTLRAGEALFLNNRWLLHNRTAFTDHPDRDRRRHLVRLWLRAAA
jgi:alpha-ketoglutarate-dependent taurine dioxygenase